MENQIINLNLLLMKEMICDAAMRQYMWIYSGVQFLLVVFFAHLFYSYVSIPSFSPFNNNLNFYNIYILERVETV